SPPPAERPRSAARAARVALSPRKRTCGPRFACYPGRPCAQRRGAYGNRPSLLLRDLLLHPPEEIRRRLFDSEPLELGRHLPAVIGRMIDNVAQHRPRRQGGGSAAAAQREDGVEPLRRQRRLKLREATIGALQQT